MVLHIFGRDLKWNPHNHRRVPLEELYEKAMSRSRGKLSSA
nr:hypothetical protein [Anaerostipes hadrus]